LHPDGAARDLQFPMKKKGASGAGGVARKILALLKSHPEGLDIRQLREFGNFGETQQHLDRRLRDLDPHHRIDRLREGRRLVYRYAGERPDGEWGYEKISKTLRAKILSRDGRRCRMCGKTVDADAIRLHVDHKIPQEWGGITIEENLWALCSVCNEGKRNYYASFDAGLMRGILGHGPVHRRLAELLRAHLGQWIDCDLLEFVANFDDYQTDWRKRLRELRYFGLEIESTRKRQGKRNLSLYRVVNWTELPEDPSRAAREYERRRRRKNRENT